MAKIIKISNRLTHKHPAQCRDLMTKVAIKSYIKIKLTFLVVYHQSYVVAYVS